MKRERLSLKELKMRRIFSIFARIICFTFLLWVPWVDIGMAQEAPAAGKGIVPLTDEEVSGVRDFLTKFKGVKFDGFVESFYQYNSVDPGSGNPIEGNSRGVVPALGSGRRGETTVIPPNTAAIASRNMLIVRGYDREDNSFTLNSIELHIYKDPEEPGDIGFRITTLYGEMASRLTFVQVDERIDDDDFTVGEGFVWWKIPIGKGIDLKFGKFTTWIGAEPWQSVWNPNWSRSLLNILAIPATNTGFSLGYPVLDNLYFSLFLVNGWDTFVDNNKGKTIGAQIRYNLPDMPILRKAFMVLNTSHGPEQHGNSENLRNFFDWIFQFSPTDWLTLNTNVDFGTEQFERGFGGAVIGLPVNLGDNRLNRKWWGVAQIVNFQPTERVGLALRGEYFWDQDGARDVLITPAREPGAIAPRGASMAEFTATINIKLREKLMIRPEVRYDKILHAPGGLSNAEQFDNHNKNLSTAIALTYEF